MQDKPSSVPELDPERRQALVLGDGPRITPLSTSELSAEALNVLAGMIALSSAIEPRNPEELERLKAAHASGSALRSDELEAQVSPIVRTMLRHTGLFAIQLEISRQLIAHGALPARDRELVILRIGWLCGAPYEWGEHVHIGKTSGLRAEEIERITQGSQAPGWSEHERALLRAAEELHTRALISDETWATLAATYDERQLIELPIVIGQYQTVAYYQNSLRLSLTGGNRGLAAR